MMNPEKMVRQFLEKADIQINGPDPWDLQVHNNRFFLRVWANGSIGLGESYMEGWWDCEDLEGFFFRIIDAKLYNKVKGWRFAFNLIKAKLINRQTKNRSMRVAKMHYNLSNEMYSAMLGETMAYTCAYWKQAKNLDEAQYAKYDLICRKLDIKADDRILELGSGWGGFAKYASEKYGCHIVTVNIAKEQVKYARNICDDKLVSVCLCDYRDRDVYNPAGEKYDKIVSIGLCEHVGPKNYRSWFRLVFDQLKDRGLFLLHSIGSDRTKYISDSWIDKYIFPNGIIPSTLTLSRAMDGIFVMEDWHNFGSDYHLTLMEWFKNFDHYWKVKEKSNADLGISLKNISKDTFYRMLKYYLLSCAGCFRSRENSLWQIVMSKNGILGGYKPFR